ncbi:LysR family transcriptional regulator [Streptomyces sp. NPDC059651]|uniref:LysR family transcriptional regulator n=1 Tax=Streptomyces sp. NPDC059651 TaxID=3346897 RepID=UPI0036980168
MDLTVQQLRYFAAVAHELHFARAAERLRISAPSLSRQIAALERKFGAPLFRRDARRVELTELGSELLPMARRSIAALDDVVSWAEERRSGGAAVRVGLVVGSRIGSVILNEAARAFPAARWKIRRLGFDGSLTALRTDLVDVVLAPALAAPSGPGLHAVPLWTEGRVLVVGTGHPLAGRDSVTVDELVDEHFVAALGDEALIDWLGLPRSDGFTPKVAYVAGTFEEVLDICSAGLGVNIAGAGAVSASPRPGVVFVPVRGLPDATVYLLRSARAPSPAVLAIEELAVRVARRETRRSGER